MKLRLAETSFQDGVMFAMPSLMMRGYCIHRWDIWDDSAKLTDREQLLKFMRLCHHWHMLTQEEVDRRAAASAGQSASSNRSNPASKRRRVNPALSKKMGASTRTEGRPSSRTRPRGTKGLARAEPLAKMGKAGGVIMAA
jgi:hypothetical protein